MKKKMKRIMIFCLTIFWVTEFAMLNLVFAGVKQGNTIGNLNHGGFCAKEGDWLYLRSGIVTTTISKIKTDGSGYTEINIPVNSLGGISGINVIDGWMYYVKPGNGKRFLCKRKIDSEEEIKLFSGIIGSPNGGGLPIVCNDWIYFVSTKGNYSYLYRMKTDGTKKAVVAKTGQYRLMSFCVSGQWVYYIDLVNGLYRVKTNGTSKKCLAKPKQDENFYFCDVSEDWVFYYNSTDNNVYRIKKDGSEKQKFLSKVNNFNINGEWVYYDSPKGLFKIKADGTSKKTIVKSGTIICGMQVNAFFDYFILEGTIYFKFKEGREMNYPVIDARVDTDGTDLKYGWIYSENYLYGNVNKRLLPR